MHMHLLMCLWMLSRLGVLCSGRSKSALQNAQHDAVRTRGRGRGQGRGRASAGLRLAHLIAPYLHCATTRTTDTPARTMCTSVKGVWQHSCHRPRVDWAATATPVGITWHNHPARLRSGCRVCIARLLAKRSMCSSNQPRSY